MKRLLSILLLFVFLLSAASCSFIDTLFSKDDGGITQPLDALRISYLDVGQGDATFIEFPNGKNMLIDAGLADAADTVIAYIDGLGYEKIDYLLATHPDGDHIGGMRAVVNRFEIGDIYMPDVDHDTVTYERLLEAIEQKGKTIHQGRAGVSILEEENLTVKILAPVKDTYEDTNSYSLVLRITYGNHAFLFMGDATLENESELTGDFSADVVKVGHHGSHTSSGESFVRATKAKYAVISVGADNRYQHPKQSVIERWMAIGATVLRTDTEGTVVALSDGVNLTVNDELTVIGERVDVPDPTPIEQPPAYVLNKSTKKIHTPDCGSVANMAEQNKEPTNRTLSDLLLDGYTACGNCDPSE